MTKILVDKLVLEQALEAFRMCVPMDGKHAEVDAAFKALRAAMAEPAREPDDEVCDGLRGGMCIHQDPNQCKPEIDCPAFYAPSQLKKGVSK